MRGWRCRRQVTECRRYTARCPGADLTITAVTRHLCMTNQQRRTLQHTHTTLSSVDVLAAAKRYFSTRHGIYAAFPEKEGPTFISLSG